MGVDTSNDCHAASEYTARVVDPNRDRELPTCLTSQGHDEQASQRHDEET